MCNKVAYVSRRDARSAARWMERNRKAQSQHAYECHRCGYWHLTTMSRERAKQDVKARRERRREREAIYEEDEPTIRYPAPRRGPRRAG